MLLDAFHALMNIWVLIAAVAGIVIGIIIGAIPGLGPTMAIALLIPVTFSMALIPAITLLLGVYQGAIFGGSISAILLNVPGTPSSAATAIDGYAMARRGEGGRALRIALYASVAGNIFSCLVLMMLAQPLASMALDFGPAEMATLMVFALTVIVLFGGGVRLDAAIMALLGIFAGIIGLDPIEGTPRFTFGSFAMENGLQLIPVLVGLFAMSEVFLQLFKSKHSDAQKAEIPELLPSKLGFVDMWRMRVTLLWSSLIGTFVGILPGIGSTVPAFMSYSLARSRSRKPETFGRGADEGVAAPEAANNAVTGGALIPTLALGIPGDAVTAVILGAFMLQGLAPGPFLFRDYGVEVYAIFEALILSSIPTILFGLLLFKVAVHVIRIQPRHLFPSVIILALLGAFSVNNSLTDVWVMLGAGFVGFLLRRSGFPLPPLLIGLILGKPLEQSLRQALLTSNGSVGIFFHSSIAMTFIVITILCVVASIAYDFVKRRPKTGSK
ncbi:Tripartite tricarboxylate transporter TctA family protein [Marinomonas spartinae]|uniref:tripartite tricarboxylate transporter permease n=1 Tax=Marinomonas spartinae TaxID=1792290 RepID=UPI000808B570|nr:tripartite tricarboxylate transporter permease [Marinomonas spartinae]SBS36071.1 Tripartite tricarboxylate transporter TctA family protein [Marinomonas spartinae]